MRTARFRADGGTHTGEWTADGILTNETTYRPHEVTMLPPVEPTTVIGVGPNYHSNLEHYGRETPAAPSDLLLFVKPAPNALVPHGGAATLRQPGEFHFEAELGVVIGEECSDVSVDAAMEYVEGFTCANEITNKGVPESQYDPGNHVRAKAFDDSLPIGPAVASPDLVPRDATIELHQNGEKRQCDTREGLVFSVPELLAEITTYLTLEPGDVIATGSPAGVGELDDGDTIEVSIEGIGTLEHTVELPSA